ncbi:hypothetical protein X975_04250, partial [Stegodyphus mimosarum]
MYVCFGEPWAHNLCLWMTTPGNNCGTSRRTTTRHHILERNCLRFQITCSLYLRHYDGPTIHGCCTAAGETPLPSSANAQWLYQQDNTRPHTACISQRALEGVQMLPWPPFSPDLSPIEYI